MIFALSRSTAVTLGVVLVIFLICALILVSGNGSIEAIWARRGMVVLAINLMIAALCIPSVFAVAHAALFAKFWLFPRLDGEWDAVIRSNWPRIRRTYEAARSKRGRFDAMVDELSSADEEEGTIRAKVTVRSSLLLISLTLEPVGTERVSRIRFVRPQWLKPNLPELSYVYEQADAGQVGRTDSRRHFGAGVLAYDKDREVLEGTYWTQRRDDAGFNTAGTIVMTRRG